jgi:hypothetical protein
MNSRVATDRSTNEVANVRGEGLEGSAKMMAFGCRMGLVAQVPQEIIGKRRAV